MDNFYTIVLIVAIIALIVVLTYIGIVMSYGEGTTSYPPQSTTCPDYWVINKDGECEIPSDGKRNTGNLYEGGLLKPDKATTPGIDTDKNVINFAHNDWKASGQEICAKQVWAKQYGVVWDGVTNYNEC